jgi:hypothetical protein
MKLGLHLGAEQGVVQVTKREDVDPAPTATAPDFNFVSNVPSLVNQMPAHVAAAASVHPVALATTIATFVTA